MKTLLETPSDKTFGPAPDSAVVLAMDILAKPAGAGKAGASFERAFFLCKGSDLLDGKCADLRRVEPGDIFSEANLRFFAGLDRADSQEKVHIFIYPTRTYSEGFGGHILSDIAPEDRRVIRRICRRYDKRTHCLMVPLQNTNLFETLPGYLQNDDEKRRFEKEKAVCRSTQKTDSPDRRKWISFDPNFLLNIKAIFMSCTTRPNKQDYQYLIYKTFGLNLAVRLAFVILGVTKGGLPLTRAVLSTAWYQIQDAVFTVFGQTYMKFLGKMTGLLRIRDAHVGDFLFVYIQLCGFEFLNRLVLGPLGENPLVYTWTGLGLIFLNILQGMISGGPLIPAINKIRKVGAISHSTMMHLYQLSSLTMQFGLFATFGYQKFYAFLTGATLLLSWSSYILFSTFFKDPDFRDVKDAELIATLDKLAAVYYGSTAARN